MANSGKFEAQMKRNKIVGTSEDNLKKKRALIDNPRMVFLIYLTILHPIR